jgi:hypothetical protein
MVNNATNINKTNNHLSSKIIEHNKEHDVQVGFLELQDKYFVIIKTKVLTHFRSNSIDEIDN